MSDTKDQLIEALQQQCSTYKNLLELRNNIVVIHKREIAALKKVIHYQEGIINLITEKP
jgi:uncharacterized coiled-coil DUF342 family protein